MAIRYRHVKEVVSELRAHQNIIQKVKMKVFFSKVAHSMCLSVSGQVHQTLINKLL